MVRLGTDSGGLVAVAWAWPEVPVGAGPRPTCNGKDPAGLRWSRALSALALLEHPWNAAGLLTARHALSVTPHVTSSGAHGGECAGGPCPLSCISKVPRAPALGTGQGAEQRRRGPGHET